MSTSSKNSVVYDYAVVGSGLSGLAVATALSQEGAQVLLLEAADTFGGLNRPVQTKIGTTENGLRFLPDTEQSRRSLEFLSSLTQEPIGFQSVERSPLTYESGGLRDFVGFGDVSPDFYDELAYFLSPRELLLEKPFHHHVQTLFHQFKGTFLPKSHVTRFHVGNGKVHSLTVNGQKNLLALNVIYAGPLKQLSILLPDEALPARARQKIAKSRTWTSIGLDLIHSASPTDSTGIHVLNGTTQDDVGPCVGRFQGQLSQWVSFIDDEDAEDTEKISAALKKIKRQIKRAYPQALEGVLSERILVVPSSSGMIDLKLTGHQTLPQVNNFWVASGSVHPLKNIAGSLAQAQLVVTSLGLQSPEDLSLGTKEDSTETVES